MTKKIVKTSKKKVTKKKKVPKGIDYCSLYEEAIEKVIELSTKLRKYEKGFYHSDVGDGTSFNYPDGSVLYPQAYIPLDPDGQGYHCKSLTVNEMRAICNILGEEFADNLTCNQLIISCDPFPYDQELYDQFQPEPVKFNFPFLTKIKNCFKAIVEKYKSER